MALKTFNIDQVIYKQFADYCKKEGISMSKRIENFIKNELESLSKKQPIIRQKAKDEHPLMKYC